MPAPDAGAPAAVAPAANRAPEAKPVRSSTEPAQRVSEPVADQVGNVPHPPSPVPPPSPPPSVAPPAPPSPPALLDPVTKPLEPVTNTLAPVTEALAPVTGTLKPITGVLDRLGVRVGP